MSMNSRSRTRIALHVLTIAAALFFGMTRESYAYVDPGSASAIIMAILGGMAALGYTARLYWARFKRLFNRAKKDKHEPPSK